ncbi:hypothetical protein [Paraburkholderia phosphatilytica]|uniref:hypothetical protein n=1 Tax=Paraburkholderia phosphatilytica TaxID=2282883 RepID=UPI001F0CC09D|nr:hypothetical protein [Paraburkholderia phosphatilytica]
MMHDEHHECVSRDSAWASASVPAEADAVRIRGRRSRVRANRAIALVASALLLCGCVNASSSSNTDAAAHPDAATPASATPLASASATTALPASDVGARPKIEADKAQQLAAEQQIAARIPQSSGMTLQRTRPLTLRDSGLNGSMMFARDVDFRVTGDIGFYIHRMAATLVPVKPGDPAVFDDPTSVTIDVHRGEVTLDAAKLTAIFNRYLFQYEGSPLRNMRVTPGDGVVRMTGEMHRGTWVPIVLTGTLAMRNADELVFHPTHTEVAGVDADKLMQAAHVKMSDLLKVDTPIAKLDGDDVVMQVAKLTPPPALKMSITRIDVTPQGVNFTLDDHTLPAIHWPVTMPERGMLLLGGDVKFMRSIPMNVDLAITPLDSDKPDASKANTPFVLDLYHYREQMAAGYFTFDEAGALDVHLPSYVALAGDGANSAATAQRIGSASAHYNDSFLRAQQSELAEARDTWRHIPASLHTASFDPRASGLAAIDDERHSSGPAPLIHVQNVDFYVSGNIGFHVRSLDAQMVPKHPGQPVDLDNPDGYDIRILGGEVVEPWSAMAALFNDYLLDYQPRSLNDLHLKPGDRGLTVTGGIKLWNHFPGVWLPTTMHGTLGVRDDRHLVYTPTSVKVLGVPQAGLLRALDIPLSSLTPFVRKGVALEGNDLVFDQYTVFPPPVLQGHLASAKVTDEGLVLTFRRLPGASVAHAPSNAGSSYVWIESGDVKMFNALVVNARTLIRNSREPQSMHFDLYGYRRDVSKGKVMMGEDGVLNVDLATR